MEQDHRSRKASKFATDDVISSMPDDVITDILKRLPLQDAVRTGTLSKNWRDKWTMINQLVFDEDFYEYLQENKKEKDYGEIVSSLLLHFKGAITKFHLYIEKGYNSVKDVEDINKWVLVLSQKDVIEKFTLLNMDATLLMLTTDLFSCSKLKHLELYNCHFRPMSSFRGFPNLLSLDLSEVVFGNYTCGKFLTCCPLLEILKLRDNTPSEIRRGDIEKLKNLKVLNLPLCELVNMEMITSSGIFQLLGYFPKLQELYLDFWDCKVLADAKMSLSTALPYLKTLGLYEIDFNNGIMVSCAIDLICGIPNLETLLIKSAYEDDDPAPAGFSSDVDFSRLRQVQLRKVEFISFRGLENEECMRTHLQLRKVDNVSFKGLVNEECTRTSVLDFSPFLKDIDTSALEVLCGVDGQRISSNSLMISHDFHQQPYYVT